MSNDKPKIHPHKFMMWLSLISIVMLFGGLTSAYIVKRNQANWLHVPLPNMFYYSTIVIIISSVALYLCIKKIKIGSIKTFQVYFYVSIILGITFIISQLLAFDQLAKTGFVINGNVAGSFIYVIAAIHILHVLGGIIAFIIILLKYYFGKESIKIISALEIASIYWHFVDALWIYLLIFFNVAK